MTVSYDVLSRDNYRLPGFAFLITRFRFLVTVFSKAQEMNIHKNANITIHNTFMRCKKVACHFEITPKPENMDKFGDILTCVHVKSCLVS